MAPIRFWRLELFECHPFPVGRKITTEFPVDYCTDSLFVNKDVAPIQVDVCKHVWLRMQLISLGLDIRRDLLVARNLSESFVVEIAASASPDRRGFRSRRAALMDVERSFRNSAKYATTWSAISSCSWTSNVGQASSSVMPVILSRTRCSNSAD